MSETHTDIQDKILLQALEDVPFDGWTWEVIERAANKAGYNADMAEAVFSGQLKGALNHFADWVDRQMMARLQETDSSAMRVRDKIKVGVVVRLEILEPHKEAAREYSSYWLRPFRKIEAGKLLWRSADLIWHWAGDEATDYNHYTKRALLVGVMSTTMLYWLNDTSPAYQNTLDFLDRRIDNVLSIGKVAGKILGRAKIFKDKAQEAAS